ncbi:MAG: hypothetical protein JOZ80_19845 [Acidobacteriaceae bacterium]|nr:hypothetical protein [Acidobacteriaceae bacterium]
MELLLNLLWLALAVPGVWIWVHNPSHACRRQEFGRYRPLLLLGCALIVLFPVISATDDLNAMRSEMEESSPSTRQLKHSAAKTTTHTGTLVSPRATILRHFCDDSCRLISLAGPDKPKAAPNRETASRGPPARLIS